MTDSSISIFVQVVLNGLAVGSIYALVALGFVLIYKATDVFNFAQGELMMLGAYFCYTLIALVGLDYLTSFLLTLGLRELLLLL